jgi:hypothetical protein
MICKVFFASNNESLYICDNRKERREPLIFFTAAVTDLTFGYRADERRKQEKYKTGDGFVVASDDDEEEEEEEGKFHVYKRDN